MYIAFVCWGTGSCDAPKSSPRPRARIANCRQASRPMPGARTQTLATTDYIPVTLPRKQAHSRPDSWTDVLVIGAGPTGLACAIECQKIGLKALLLDKGCLVNSIYHYPTNMTFFTTPELLEIGDIPFACSGQKPTRQEALEDYWRGTEEFNLYVCKDTLGKRG